jgi:hypothetical protein
MRPWGRTKNAKAEFSQICAASGANVRRAVCDFRNGGAKEGMRDALRPARADFAWPAQAKPSRIAPGTRRGDADWRGNDKKPQRRAGDKATGIVEQLRRNPL